MRRTTLTAALGLTLVLTGCSNGDGGADSTTDHGATSDTQDAGGATTQDTDAGTAAEPMGDPVCEEFFQTGAVALAERADDNRSVLESGQALDPASWGEIDLLSQRITTLTESASGEQADLLERINAPFVEASDAVLEDEDKSPTDAEIEVGQIDVTDSAAAQDEFETACTG